jgi:hypothetical protein
MNFNSELNNIFNLGLLIGFAILWVIHVLYFGIPRLVPLFRSIIKLKDSDLNAISNFTMEVGVGLVIGLGVISSLSSDWADAVGYIYALISTLAFCLIWRYVKSHEVENE